MTWTNDDPIVRTGIELHLDVLIDFIESGQIKGTEAEIDMLKSLSCRVGGFDATENPLAAAAYEYRTRMMADKLGAFYGVLQHRAFSMACDCQTAGMHHLKSMGCTGYCQPRHSASARDGR